MILWFNSKEIVKILILHLLGRLVKRIFLSNSDSLNLDLEKYGLGTTIWSPLASGALTGKYLEGIPEGSRASLSGYEWLKKSMVESDRGQERMKRVASLAPIAENLNVSMSSLAIAWCLLNKNVSTVILGASKLEQLEENLKSSEVVELLNENIQEELLLI